MDPTLKALINLLLEAVPTIFLLIVLTIYLKQVFFKPLQAVLDKRRQETEGARELAEKALASAEHKASEFERLLTAAKLELYREQEAQRNRLLQDQAQAIAEARQQAEARINDARRDLAAEVEQATADLTEQAQTLSRQMISSIFGRRAA
jgi:F-type H+-transporting ATPase subunit b